MNQTAPQAPRTDEARPGLSTEELAKGLGIKPQTLRAALCRDGKYFGIKPVKAKNRFLRWPADAVERLTAGEGAQMKTPDLPEEKPSAADTADYTKSEPPIFSPTRSRPA